ncbi:MAG: Nramp family divalent metal transporter [Candidatus Diapherotrites archaeon]|nr:Nramp family divalent metal transporter [Candidatus Diapherotrites archaeon]
MPGFDWKKIALLLAIVGPGIITAAVDNDAPGIATYSVAGANFGFSFMWTLIPIAVILIIIQEMSARLAIVTGKGLGDLIREQFGLKLTFFLMLGLVLTNIANTIAQFAGISASAEIFGVSKYVAVPLAAIFVWILITKGTYKSVEKAFLLATVFYLTYVVVGLTAKPDWNAIVPTLFQPQMRFDMDFLLMLTALVGTTIAPWMQFYIMAAIVEKGIRKEDLKYTKIDVVAGSIITLIIAFFIIMVTAVVLHSNGMRVETAEDAAMALAPVAGEYASRLFAFGLLSASLFAAAILPLATAFYLSEAFGWEHGVDKKFSEAPYFYTAFTATIAVSALVIMLPGIPLIPLMVASQAMNGLLLPAVLILMLLLVNDRKLMGPYANSWKSNLVAGLCSAMLVLMSLFLAASVFFR